MNTQFYFPDCASLTGWSREYDYTNGYRLSVEETLVKHPPQAQIEFASLREDQLDCFRYSLVEPDWTAVGWYPSIHGTYEKASPVHMFMRQSKKPLFANRTSGILTGTIGLGCSTSCKEGMNNIKPSYASEYPFGPFGAEPAQKRQTIWRWLLTNGESPEETFTREGFRKIATTELAEYWYFGLKPGESR